MNMSQIIQKLIENRIKSLREQKENLDKISHLNVFPNRKKLSENIENKNKVSIIAEIKPASPTLGLIRKTFNISNIAKKMEKGGAIGLSIITEPTYFNGSFENLIEAMNTSILPCLMKDFIIDEIQMEIAKYVGVKNILLINYLINIEKMFELSLKYGLEPLVEIHKKEELSDIEHLFEVGFKPKLIGVNNRNLKTLNTDLTTSTQLIPEVRNKFGEKVKIISESGINTYKDIQFLQGTDVDAFLIGSSIMKSEDIVKKIRDLRGKK
ncbi:MAG: indole-3-glycerol-phosphate synthase [Candidatus Lokiarchaeota archaeon]|nr:indole-3-glycerol-phosphate synthase [Candidatus Lokiarchaeota archaeon]